MSIHKQHKQQQKEKPAINVRVIYLFQRKRRYTSHKSSAARQFYRRKLDRAADLSFFFLNRHQKGTEAKPKINLQNHHGCKNWILDRK